jgi:ribonuclease HII
MKTQCCIVGLDEVGRGSLAGPLVVGAATLIGSDPELPIQLLGLLAIPKIRDSKKLSIKQREIAYTYLESRLIWGVGEVEASEIDYFGLAAALRLASERALASLKKRGYLPERILADAGLFHPFEATIPTERFVKGDENIIEITLASIMAKVWRDRMMYALAKTYPEYGFMTNVGYGTAEHRAALKVRGLSPEHRRSFIHL